MQIVPIRDELHEGAIVRIAHQRSDVIDKIGRRLIRPRIGVSIRYVEFGEMRLPTGQLIGCSLRELIGGQQLHLEVNPDVSICRVGAAVAHSASEHRLALGILQFRENQACRYKLVAFQGETAPGAWGLGGWVSCIADASHLGALNTRYLKDPWPFVESVEKHLFRDDLAGDVIRIDGHDEVSIACWVSGLDGNACPVYVGYDVNGRMCNLVVDTELIEYAINGVPVKCRRVGDVLNYRTE